MDTDIRFGCPVCSHDFKLPLSDAGRAFNCPECGELQTVPGERDAKLELDAIAANHNSTKWKSEPPTQANLDEPGMMSTGTLIGICGTFVGIGAIVLFFMNANHQRDMARLYKKNEETVAEAIQKTKEKTIDELPDVAEAIFPLAETLQDEQEQQVAAKITRQQVDDMESGRQTRESLERINTFLVEGKVADWDYLDEDEKVLVVIIVNREWDKNSPIHFGETIIRKVCDQMATETELRKLRFSELVAIVLGASAYQHGAGRL